MSVTYDEVLMHTTKDTVTAAATIKAIDRTMVINQVLAEFKGRPVTLINTLLKTCKTEAERQAIWRQMWENFRKQPNFKELVQRHLQMSPEERARVEKEVLAKEDAIFAKDCAERWAAGERW